MTDKPQSLNLELLIKLLKLSASDNDAEALLALRKATEVLKKFGGDWEALLHGKVTVIADPFTVAAAPPPVQHREAPRAPTPRPQAPPPRPQAAAQTPPAAARFGHQKAWRQPAAQTPPAASRNTLRKQRVSLDDLA